PQTKIKMVLEIGAIDLNPESFPEQMWKLPDIAGSPVVDLGRLHAHQQQQQYQQDGAGHVQLRRRDVPGVVVDPAYRQDNPFAEHVPQGPYGVPTRSASREFGEEPPWAADRPASQAAGASPFPVRQ